jgi:RNA polymerase sigma factor (TIGR02999 family)
MTSADQETAITQLLGRAAEDDAQAKEQLYRLVYDDLRQVAHRLIGSQAGRELQTTAVVNEVLLRFERARSLKSMANRRVFFSVAARAMNHVLLDHYRRRSKLVDGGQRMREPLDDLLGKIEEENGCDVESLDGALRELQRTSPRQHAVVMYRFYAGLTVPQIADLLQVSPKTVERDWRLARAKLYRILEK